jgi:uncharacterized membrane protein YbaN (DUF454 family)
LGLLAAAFGVAGVVLPLVPTTPFLLFAAFAFARSSPRLHGWLVTHPRLGRPINDWRRHRSISRRAKVAASILMAASLVVSVAIDVSKWILLGQAIALAGAAAFVLSRPSAPHSRD